MNLQELHSQFPAAPQYLSQIFIIGRNFGVVSNARLADRLGVSRPAVSQAVGRLKRLGLVDQDRYGTIGLSETGRKVAENVIQRHLLIEHLLVGVLGYPWDKCDVEAGVLQSVFSDELTEFLIEKLGNPQTCPHGNPLPGADIEKHYVESPSLQEAEEGTPVKIIRITEEGELLDGLLSFCLKNELLPGTEVTIVSHGNGESVCSYKKRDIRIPASFARCIQWETV